jgi:hypothetical protein
MARRNCSTQVFTLKYARVTVNATNADWKANQTTDSFIDVLFYKRGHKIKFSWMRGSHTAVSFLAPILSRFEVFKGTDNPYFNITIPQKLKRIWQFLEFCSALPVIIAKFVIPSMEGYWVLADRYSLDLTVWICITSRDYGFLRRFESRLLVLLSKKTTARFFVTADFEELEKRTNEPWFPREQLTLYKALAKSVDAITIDTTNKSVDDSLHEILKALSVEHLIS